MARKTLRQRQERDLIKQQQEEEAFKEGVEMNKTLTIIKRMAKMAG